MFITFELPVREKKIKRGRKDTEEKRERGECGGSVEHLHFAKGKRQILCNFKGNMINVQFCRVDPINLKGHKQITQANAE